MEPNSIRTLQEGTVVWADDGETDVNGTANLLRIHAGFIGAADRIEKHIVFVGLPRFADHPEAARTLLAALAASMGIPQPPKPVVTRDTDGILRIDGDTWTGENMEYLKRAAQEIEDRREEDATELADLHAVIAFLEGKS